MTKDAQFAHCEPGHPQSRQPRGVNPADIIPTGDQLIAMLDRAFEKFDKARRREAANERARAAMAHNNRVARERVAAAFPRSGTRNGNPF